MAGCWQGCREVLDNFRPVAATSLAASLRKGEADAKLSASVGFD